ncbi:MAG: DUF2807 domain-containing protein [Cyclobacteriaceae bacterium]|nr:DUF2807 domain-containing protein [Cyclobacteriaceae bacterium]
MKKPLLLIAIMTLLVMTNPSAAQDTLRIAPFSKIIASPRVNVILRKGSRESVRIVYNDIPKNRVNVRVHGNKLSIYLDHARLVEKQVRFSDNGRSSRHGIYGGSSITAFVTYVDLKEVEIRGAEELRCDNEIKTKKFKLRAYGESEIRLAKLTTGKFKASLYGVNNLKIKEGTTDQQVYRLFGENKIDTRGLKSEYTSTRMYGEGTLRVSASDEVRINAFGEPEIRIEGTSFISKGIVMGRPRIQRN